MADPNQIALLKRSVKEWNTWRSTYPDIQIDLSDAHLMWADFRGADLRDANCSGADLSGADLRGVKINEADLSRADFNLYDFEIEDLEDLKVRREQHFRKFYPDLRGADLRGANFSGALLMGANLSGADLRGADFNEALLRGIEQGEFPLRSESASPVDIFLSLVETAGPNILVAAATLASIIQGFDVIERRWREHQEKHKQQSTQTPQSASASSPQPAASPPKKTPASDKEIVEILLVMDDGSQHGFKRWISNPDDLKAYIDAFSDPTSKIKPLQVVFKKREGRALVVDVTTGGKDNKQLNVILKYLEADPV